VPERLGYVTKSLLFSDLLVVTRHVCGAIGSFACLNEDWHLSIETVVRGAAPPYSRPRSWRCLSSLSTSQAIN